MPHGGSLDAKAHGRLSYHTEGVCVHNDSTLDCLDLRDTFYQIRFGLSEDKLHT